MSAPEYGTEDYRRWAALFNDITFAPTERHVLFSTRNELAEYLWDQGWRRDVRPEDVTEKRAQACAEAPLAASGLPDDQRRHPATEEPE